MEGKEWTKAFTGLSILHSFGPPGSNRLAPICCWRTPPIEWLAFVAEGGFGKADATHYSFCAIHATTLAVGTQLRDRFSCIGRVLHRQSVDL